MPIHGFPGNVISATPPSVTVNGASGVFTTEQQMQYQAAGNWPMPLTQISRSLRFNSADSAYLNRTPSSAGNRKTWTWSGWLKRSALSTGYILDAGTGPNTGLFIGGASDLLGFFDYTSPSYNLEFITTQSFRDVSAWYHIVVAVDTTQATSTNRVKIYLNGSQITAFGTATYPSQNFDTGWNNATAHRIGGLVSGGSYLNGYLTEINFIDGQQLTPASFGVADQATGVWGPRQYTGPYGTNGFYLNFSDNSGTTSTTLGKDYSGNGNNWTPNNFSVTAGAGNDSLVDTPTPYGTDTGAGGEVRGNYATFNPNDFSGGASGLSNGNLDISGLNMGNFGTFKLTSGKWYFEFRKNAVGDNQLGIASGNVYGTSANFGVTCFRRAWRDDNNSPAWLTDGSNAGSGTAQSLTTGDILGVALDLDNNAVYFAKNNTWMNSGVPTSGSSKTGAIWTDLSGGLWQIYAGGNANGCYTSLNAGQRAFAYTAPSGFKALCTQNLPTPDIGATSATQAGKYFNTVLWAGNSTANRSITGVGFQPDFVWIKDRTVANWHNLFDAVRGAGIRLVTNSTAAEVSNQSYGYLSAFNSDGFTVTNGSLGYDNVNVSGSNYVGWNWKANGAGSSNTAGTITSTVSVSTTSGFSVVTYTGNGIVGATRGHGLGVAPNMIFVKGRSDADNWHVYHSSLGNTGGLFLNATSAFTVSSFFWNDTSPSSTVFTTSNGNSNNANGVTYVAYCFAAVAGYSAFGKYTGNGSTDGPFIYTGFRPAYVLIKRTNDTSSWNIVDVKRNTYNVMNSYLSANTSSAEDSTYSLIDSLSNGFKVRQSLDFINQNTGTFIYAAFAEFPFKYTLAR